MNVRHTMGLLLELLVFCWLDRSKTLFKNYFEKDSIIITKNVSFYPSIHFMDLTKLSPTLL